MKKVGILTFNRANNYGALLQAYALKSVLQKLGTKVTIVNYLCHKIESDFRFFSGKKSIKWFVKKSLQLLFLPLVIKNNNKFVNFKNKYLIDTIPFNSKNIVNIEKEYDVFITGSDQVFNPRITDFDKNYFLDFVKDKNKCFSYAASFGLNYENLTEKEKVFMKQNLQKFKLLSLREKQGLNIINNLINIKTIINIDPSLLLSRDNWVMFSKQTKQDDFILVYLQNNNDKIVNFAKKLAYKKNIKLLNISLNFINKIGIKTICPSPEEWVGYFLKAKYVVTNSFHGLCFSINFNKNFFVDFLPKTSSVNSRLENLLDITSLRDRLIDNIETDYDKPIYWESVNKIMEKEREKSLNYLKSIVL